MATEPNDATPDEGRVAPHGRDQDGVPLAPFGLTVEGHPRKSNRGAKPGQRGNGGQRSPRGPRGPRVTSGAKKDAERKDALVGLADMVVVTPLAGLSVAPMVQKWLGHDQADSLAGDAVLVDHFMPAVADALIVLSQSKPRTLAWLDQVEEKAPYLLLMNVGIQLAKAVASNHVTPNPRLNHAGRLRVAVQAQPEFQG